MNNMAETNKARVSFAAIDPFRESHIVEPTETQLRGRDMVGWGLHNDYPEYLLGLYNNVTSLRAIINGTIDFILGDDVRCTMGVTLNAKGDTAADIVRSVAKDYLLYGGFALEVIRGEDLQTVSEINYIDLRFLRSNKDNDVFFYSEDFGRGYTAKDKVMTYPKFMPNGQHPASILFVKTVDTQVYPAPCYAASVKACEIERAIDEYHLNSINNGFAGSYIINFNNGVPTDQIKAEVERNITEKFAGQGNAGRMMISWNDNKDSQTTIQKAELQDFGEKYQALATHTRQQIFTAFCATPNLFGIPTETTGFSEQEFNEAFRLYNRTKVRPIQNKIADAFAKAYGVQGCLQFTPFSLDGAGESTVK